jgi:hypothetical protein
MRAGLTSNCRSELRACWNAPPDGGQFAGWELTGAAGLSEDETMAKHRIHSIEFKRQVALDFIAARHSTVSPNATTSRAT